MISYTIGKVKNKRTEQFVYYARPYYVGTIKQDQLCQRIAEKTTLTRADVLCALTALEASIAEKLANTGIVRLGHLGNFKTYIRSKGGQAVKKEVGKKDISHIRANFLQSAELKKALKDNAKFRLVQL